MSTVASFTIEKTQVLDETGNVVAPLPDFAKDPEALAAMYRAMVLTRTFDAKAVAMQRTGKLGTFASSLGQEAIGVGLAAAMRPEDVLVPSYREQAAQFVRGMKMTHCLLYWGGDERGSDFREGPARHDFPNCVPIGTQIPHAVGAAYAIKLRKEPRVVVGVLGDGGTSKGDFYEGANFAGVWHLPLVLVVNNNQWAISLPRSRQTAAQTLAQKAIAAGFDGVQVDGNDVIAVREVVASALDKARNGGGPTLVEAVCYRLCDHTTADDATRYRDAESVNAAWKLEPIARLRDYMAAKGYWNKEREEALNRECAEAVNRAVDEYLATPVAPPEQMFDCLYATLPKALEPQRALAIKLAPRHAKPHG
ncbi:MAG: pyruvate dehydrogenase (acetyl-transferring) E1 component subunit alpha [Bacillota bacterium]